MTGEGLSNIVDKIGISNPIQMESSSTSLRLLLAEILPCKGAFVFSITRLLLSHARSK